MKPAPLSMYIWADIFLTPWFTRQELAQIANKICDRKFAKKLQKLLHNSGKPTLGYLKVYSNKPNKTCKFPLRKWKIQKIVYLDDKVLNFLDKLKPLFTNVHLDLWLLTTNVQIVLLYLLPLLRSIRVISFNNGDVELFERLFPGTMVLATMELDVYDAKPKSIPTLLNWLTTPLDVDQHGPRFLSAAPYKDENVFPIVDAVRKQFLTATVPSTFVIFTNIDNDEGPFKLKNAATKEQLTVKYAMFKDNGIEYHYAQILRHSLGADDKMRDWIEERAYFVKTYGGNVQMISIRPELTIGRINKEVDSMDE